MGTILSVNVGVNFLDNDADHKIYESAQTLRGANNDAYAMHKWATECKAYDIDKQIILNQNAGLNRIIETIVAYAGAAKNGDTVIITFAGHGVKMKVPVDRSRGLNSDGYHEAVCLYDTPLIDEVIVKLLQLFRFGVNVIVVTDCCYGGGVSGTERELFLPGILGPALQLSLGNSYQSIVTSEKYRDDEDSSSAPRFLPIFDDEETTIELIKKGIEAVDKVVSQNSDIETPINQFRASIIHLSACMEGEETFDGFPYGKFTEKLNNVYELSKELKQRFGFLLNYKDAHYMLKKMLLGRTNPTLSNINYGDQLSEEAIFEKD